MKDNPIKVTREEAIKIIKKALENKETVRKYLRNEITLEELEKKGLKLAKPL